MSSFLRWQREKALIYINDQKMKEKYDESCSHTKIETCLKDPSRVCLPKLFMGYLPGSRVQPHKGSEFVDIHGEVSVGKKHYYMKGIIKKNTLNNKRKVLKDMLTKPVL